MGRVGLGAGRQRPEREQPLALVDDETLVALIAGIDAARSGERPRVQREHAIAERRQVNLGRHVQVADIERDVRSSLPVLFI